MFFSESTKPEQISSITTIFQLQVVSRHAKYLGLPSMVGRNKMSFFKDIKLRVLGKISSWQANLFSCGGKEVLIKVVAQAVPAYAMSVFKLPLGLCDDMHRAIASFWWGSSRDHKSIHWSKWNNLCQAKSRGGLGFRNLSSFNQALVAKQSWRIIQEPESLVTRVLKARYFKNSSLMQARLGSYPSFIWRSILWGRNVLEKGLRWRIGNGEQLLVYQSQWIPRPITFQPISPPSLSPDTTVAELISEEQSWKEAVIRQHFLKEDADQILKIPLPRQPKPDQVLWHYDKKGNYSIKSGYQVAMKMNFPEKPSCSGENAKSWHAIWYLQLPEKVKIFMWRAANNLLAMAGNLWKRTVVQFPWCQRCKLSKEIVFHTLYECKASKKIWRLTPFGEDIEFSKGRDILSLLQDLNEKRRKSEMELIVAVCWSIWHSRNLFLFKNKKEDPQLSVSAAEAMV
ncbi:putative reverse transcriptase/RNA-dependent DNA polymerase [Citrus sinensis]|nr:putative reverse transcriptase/RNA-dependent DNA polymerase [Citrus sinensis]